MKIIFGFYGIILLWAFSISTSLTSCTKDKTIFDTVTVIQKDTILVKDSSFSSALLTAYPWKTTELRAVYGADSIYFYRGGSNNTYGFGDRSIETYTFNSGGIGSLLDAAGYNHVIEGWQLNSDNTKLTFLLHITNSALSYLVTWENIRYKNGSIFTDEYYYDNFALKYYHGQAVRFQAK